VLVPLLIPQEIGVGKHMLNFAFLLVGLEGSEIWCCAANIASELLLCRTNGLDQPICVRYTLDHLIQFPNE
jgi:hypothetical protein